MRWMIRTPFIVALFTLVTACSSAPPGGSGPTIVSFTANPATITAGGASTLSWNVTGADTVSINQGLGTVDASGSVTVNPTTTTTYTLTASNARGQKTAQATVTVQGTQAGAPTVTSFTANPPTIAAGDSSTLSWNVEDADTVSINQGVGVVSGTSITVSPSTTTTYTLTATNENGQVTAQTTVTVQGGPGDSITQTGVVILSESTFGTEMQIVSGFAGFTGYDVPLPGPFPDNPYETLVDTCTVSTIDEPVDPGIDPYPEGNPLDAGPQLTVSAGGEIYTILQKNEAFGEGTYVNDFENPPAAPLPDASLTIDIPGAEFPAFSNAAFVNAPAFTLTGPTDPGSITRNTVFSWTGTNSPQSIILLSGGDEETSFVCFAEDDGTFSFPSETQGELDAAGFTEGALDSAGRLAARSLRQDDAVLTLVTFRLTGYGEPFMPEGLGVEQPGR